MHLNRTCDAISFFNSLQVMNYVASVVFHMLTPALQTIMQECDPKSVPFA